MPTDFDAPSSQDVGAEPVDGPQSPGSGTAGGVRRSLARSARFHVVKSCRSTTAWVRGAAMVARHTPTPGAPPPGFRGTAVFDLRERSLERYAYLIPRLFYEAGYRTHIRPQLDVIGDPGYVGRYAKRVLTIPGATVGRGRPVDLETALYVTDRPYRQTGRPWGAILTVDYDWYGAPENALVIPYTMHPNQYETGEARRASAYRSSDRPIGVLFAGNADPTQYAAGPIVDVFGLLPRAEVAAALRDRTPVGRLCCPPPPPEIEGRKGTLSDLLRAVEVETAGATGYVVAPDGWRIRDGDWLALLARSSFFVAAPGVKAPLCHNVIEALAVGTVPITNYGHLMRPALTDREALLFSTADGLAACLRRALGMPEGERRVMSAAAAAYYDTHLAPESFGTRVERGAEGASGAVIPLYANSGNRTVRAAGRPAGVGADR